MGEVFISYSRADRSIAQAIAAEMQRLGVDVWWDHDLVGGEDYRARIKQILSRAQVAIVLWSRRSVDSQWVVGEASEAREKRILIPINIDGAEPPLDFRPIHSIGFEGWVEGDPLPPDLLRALGERLGRDISYSTPVAGAGSFTRLARQATQSWYLDFEGMLFYFISQALASFLGTLPIAYIVSSRFQDLPLWAPYAFALLSGGLVAPLVMRPLLKTRRLPVAMFIILVASGISGAAYFIAEMLARGMKEEVIILTGPAMLLFLLSSALADRALER